MQFEYRDCYAKFEDNALVIGNSAVERVLLVNKGGVASVRAEDKASGAVWTREEGVRWIGTPFAAENVECAFGVEDNGGLSEPFLKAELKWTGARGETLRRSYCVFPGLPFVSMAIAVEGVHLIDPAGAAEGMSRGVESELGHKAALAQEDAIDTLPMPAGHYKLKSVVLADKTDHNDALVRETDRMVYSSGWGREWDEGNIFILDDYVRGHAAILVKDAPANMSEMNREQKDLLIMRGTCAQLVGTGLAGCDATEELFGHGSVMGFGKKEELPRLFREYYRAVWAHKEPAKVMSNTWGDRSRDAAVCHEFMMHEIECAAHIGVDIVQIDDGWQKGRTANSALKKDGVWGSYYDTDPDFWAIDREKFPKGLKPLAEKARENGIEMGLWFSPDSTNDYANWRRDADTVLGHWRENGITHFKVDGVNIASKRGERNYLRFVETVYRESGNRVNLNQDITAQIRLGSLYFRQYGNLFVENRYTDSTAYYPHRTLKNLWNMCKYVPAPKMQYELLNPRRNDSLYPADDPFRPSVYSEDYLFATVMFASPLVWMEMCHLSEQDTEDLRRIVQIWCGHRADIAKCDISPIGSEPDGMSMTGLLADGGSFGYLLAFREDTTGENNVLAGTLPRKCKTLELIADGGKPCKTQLGEDGRSFCIQLGEKRSYALLRWDAQ